MKSNDWRHKNVARYTPGNTKILYFFNCLLDGMHTKIILICDFSRSVLNTRSYPALASRPQIRIISFSAGCIAIAFVAMLASKGSIPNPKLVLFLKTGICGGFTTFSTFALESATLMKSGHPKVAFLYMLLSILVGVGAIFITDLIQIQ